jgi:putative spermidine/putrescine transport system ATP-binding protein
MVAGLVDPTAGVIRFDDRVMNNIPTHKRNIGLAFQSHALFPHMSVAKNIAFGLSVKGTGKSETKRRVDEMLEMIDMASLADRMPGQLSGGQQQRVALARMLATDPDVLLFDEPLSALDRNLRDTLKYSILDLQRRTGKTAIYVTHDQSEAFAISDRIFVMNKGKIEQAGTQLDIYLRPVSQFVANFVGDNNSFAGTVTDIAESEDVGRLARVQTSVGELFAFAAPGIAQGERVLALARPENIEILADDNAREDPSVLEGKVDKLVFEGPTVRLTLDVNGQPVEAISAGMQRLSLLNKDQMSVRFRLRDVTLVKQ